MKYTSACNRTHAADACCAPATQSASCTASYLFALDTAILAVSILLSILLGVLVALAVASSTTFPRKPFRMKSSQG